MNASPLGTEIRRARTKLGLSLQALSEATAQFTTDGQPIPVRTIHGMETGEALRPHERALRPVAEVLAPETNMQRLALLAYGEDPAQLLVAI